MCRAFLLRHVGGHTQPQLKACATYCCTSDVWANCSVVVHDTSFMHHSNDVFLRPDACLAEKRCRGINEAQPFKLQIRVNQRRFYHTPNHIKAILKDRLDCAHQARILDLGIITTSTEQGGQSQPHYPLWRLPGSTEEAACVSYS